MNKPNRNHFRVEVKTRKTARLAALLVLALAILALLVAIVRGQCGPNGCPIGTMHRYRQPTLPKLPPLFPRQPRTSRPAYRLPERQPPPDRKTATNAKKSIVLVDNWQQSIAGKTRHQPITGWICAQNEVWTYIATAAHLLAGGVGNLRVDIAGTQHAAEIAGVDHTWDTLVLAIAKTDRQPLTIATIKPPIGTAVDVVGRTSGTNRGRIARYVAPKHDRHKYEMIDIAGTLARGGDSGGPIFNNAGHVVGIISGSDANYTTGTATPRLTQILQRIVTEHWSTNRQIPPKKTSKEPPQKQNQPDPQPNVKPKTTPPLDPQELTEENLDRIATQILAKMIADPKPFRGQAGDTGARGPPAEPAAPAATPPRLYWEIIPRK